MRSICNARGEEAVERRIMFRLSPHSDAWFHNDVHLNEGRQQSARVCHHSLDNEKTRALKTCGRLFQVPAPQGWLKRKMRVCNHLRIQDTLVSQGEAAQTQGHSRQPGPQAHVVDLGIRTPGNDLNREVLAADLNL